MLIALSPSLAVPTSCAPSARASSSCSRSAASGSSSAIRTRSGLPQTLVSTGIVSDTLYPPLGHRPVAAARAVAPAGLQPLADVGEAEPGAFMSGGGKLVLAAMLQPVADLDGHPVLSELPRLDADDHGLAALRHAIFDCILDDRLEEERGEPCLLEFRRNVDFDRSADREIAPSRCRGKAVGDRSPRRG